MTLIILRLNASYVLPLKVFSWLALPWPSSPSEESEESPVNGMDLI
jgi:hypothetical protein